MAVQLPEGWSANIDEMGRTFYYNVATGASQWEPPVVTTEQTYVPSEVTSVPYVADASLPEGWTAHHDVSGRTFYHNSVTGASSWDPPQATPASLTMTVAEPAVQQQLPPNWTVHQDGEGRTFYANQVTGESSWEPPVVASSQSVPSTPAQVVNSADDAWVINQMNEKFTDVFLDTITTFCGKHCKKFGNECRQDLGDKVTEFPIEYHQIHQSFVKVVEKELQKFIKTCGLTQEEFISTLHRSGLSPGLRGYEVLRSIDAMIDFDIFMHFVQDAKHGGQSPCF